MSDLNFEFEVDPLEEETKSRKTPASRAMSKAMSTSRIADESLKNAIDAAFESGWEFGIIDDRSRTADILNKLENSLTSSEEDAKLTIEIIRKMLSEED